MITENHSRSSGWHLIAPYFGFLKFIFASLSVLDKLVPSSRAGGARLRCFDFPLVARTKYSDRVPCFFWQSGFAKLWVEFQSSIRLNLVRIKYWREYDGLRIDALGGWCSSLVARRSAPRRNLSSLSCLRVCVPSQTRHHIPYPAGGGEGVKKNHFSCWCEYQSYSRREGLSRSRATDRC